MVSRKLAEAIFGFSVADWLLLVVPVHCCGNDILRETIFRVRSIKKSCEDFVCCGVIMDCIDDCLEELAEASINGSLTGKLLSEWLQELES